MFNLSNLASRSFSIFKTIFFGFSALTLLSGCSGFMGGTDNLTKMKIEALDLSSQDQQQTLDTLKAKMEQLRLENEQLGQEIVHFRDVHMKMEASITEMQTLAKETAKRAMLSGANFALHIASYKGMSMSKEGWHSYKTKYPDVFGEMEAIVSIFTSPTGEEFYRLKVGPIASKEQATEMCKVLETKGEYCSVDRFQGDLID